ncbi:MAG TPA: hypothetical protein VLC71_05865 [Thermomonas sp.]|nr:hypothetical protein [Thermomonas sp.]
MKDLHLLVGLKFSANTTFGCVRRNARKWFAARGLDWSAFVRDGLDAAVFTASGDAFALALVSAVEAQEANDGR